MSIEIEIYVSIRSIVQADFSTELTSYYIITCKFLHNKRLDSQTQAINQTNAKQNPSQNRAHNLGLIAGYSLGFLCTSRSVHIPEVEEQRNTVGNFKMHLHLKKKQNRQKYKNEKLKKTPASLQATRIHLCQTRPTNPILWNPILINLHKRLYKC